MTADTKTKDVITRLVDRIVEVIEAGTAGGLYAGKWDKPWTSVLAGAQFPVNALTERTYQGMNMLIGMVEAIDHGYPSNVWATYKQWVELDAQVRKGESGTSMLRWHDNYRCEPCGHNGSKRCSYKAHPNTRRLWSREFHVFNAYQVDGYTAIEPPELTVEPLIAVDMMVMASGAVIHGKDIVNSAHYERRKDVITLPMMAQFDTQQQYYGTLLHELTHWTGHEDRLDRPTHLQFGDEAYAKEELIAELGAVFLASHYRIEVDPHPQHVAYLASWLPAVKDDPAMLYNAAKDAQAAFDLLTEEDE